MSRTASPHPQLPFVSAEEVLRLVTPERARELIEQALLQGLDPSQDFPRSHVPAGAGHLLLMPSSWGEWVGVKLASVAPENPARGLPRIQAMYLLMDAATLTPRLMVDGATLTLLRTPAVTAAACRHLSAQDAQRLVVFGTGPQALAHAEAIAAIRPLTDVTLIGRDPDRTAAAITALQRRQVTARPGVVADDVPEADIIVCATSSAEPLFDSALISDGACVAAIGSHEPGRRELDAALMGRAQVVVEDTASALREAGDVVIALEEGALTAPDLVELAPVVRGEVHRDTHRPTVFKGTGMAWQDLAVIAGVAEHF